jgi:DNA mismatch endonuclease (patch repair protein)
MVDRVDAAVRSKVMAAIRSRDTKPELKVRRLLFSLGYRYRLHDKKLPGTPDLVFPSRKRVIFVHGCFWHGHEGCPKFRMPSSRTDYWNAKIAKNIERDRKDIAKLHNMGWKSFVVWECETGDVRALRDRLIEFLEGS